MRNKLRRSAYSLLAAFGIALVPSQAPAQDVDQQIIRNQPDLTRSQDGHADTNTERVLKRPARNSVTHIGSAPQNFSLLQGNLRQVVEQLTKGLDKENTNRLHWGANSPSIPNVLFAPGTEDLVIPALRLRNVTPTDALVLIAAAAGCKVEPLETLEAESGRHHVIGYRFFLAPPSAQIGRAAYETADLPGERTIVNAAGGPRNLPQIARVGADSSSAKPPIDVAHANQGPATRVFAIGFLSRGVTGGPKGRDEIEEKRKELHEIIQLALNTSDEPDKSKVTLRFHPQFVIAKAPVRILDIIEQCIAAAKLNETGN
jgi:hypothetical protein